jgi:hypothetical protein
MNDPPTALVGFSKARCLRACRPGVNDPPTALVGLESRRKRVCLLIPPSSSQPYSCASLQFWRVPDNGVQRHAGEPPAKSPAGPGSVIPTFAKTPAIRSQSWRKCACSGMRSKAPPRRSTATCAPFSSCNVSRYSLGTVKVVLSPPVA